MSRGQYGKPGIYNATPITLADQEGSAVAVDITGATIVTPAAGASFGASSADGSTFIQNTTTGGIAMGVYQSSPDTITTGKAAAIGIDVNRNTKVVGSVASATADSGAPVKVGGKYNASAPTLTDGNRGDLQLDVNGNVKDTLATLIAGEDLTNNVVKVEERFSFLNIAAGQATTVVKASAGFLHAITFNSAATATNVTTVYDNASGVGTVIAIPAATTATVPTTLLYDCIFNNGLTIITATANGSNMTVSYR